jgi:GAF domain-containing protein
LTFVVLDMAKSTTIDGVGVPGDPTAPEFEQLTDLATRLCGTALALVSIGGRDHCPASLADPEVARGYGYAFLAAEPLVTAEGDHLGVLCVLDKEPRELDPEQTAALRTVAAVVTDQIVLTRAAERAQRTADQLQDGLLSNRTIGKAMGLVMAQYRLDDEAAFVKLRDHSRELNMKVRTLAEEIVAHHNRGCGPSK